MNKNHLAKVAQQKLKEKKAETSVLKKAITRYSQWDDKDEFLDVIYWSRQIIGIVAGIIWGLIPLKGFVGIALFLAVNAGIMYLYFTNFQKIDEEEYGGSWELTKEGFMSSFAGFLVCEVRIDNSVNNIIEKKEDTELISPGMRKFQLVKLFSTTQSLWNILPRYRVPTSRFHFSRVKWIFELVLYFLLLLISMCSTLVSDFYSLFTLIFFSLQVMWIIIYTGVHHT